MIISLDGDLQHCPEDIPALLEKIDEGYDIASGWRKNRLDNAITRKIPSRIANWLMAKASRVELRDFGTTFKAYRAEVLKDVNLYGELHRFIPRAAAFYGARVARSAHSQRRRAPSGGSHYGTWPHVPRAVRHPHHLVPAQIFHPPDAFLRRRAAWLEGVRRRHSRLPGRCSKSWGQCRHRNEHGPLMVPGALALLTGVMMFCTGLLGK